MEIQEAKDRLKQIEKDLDREVAVEFFRQTLNGRELLVYLTPQLKKNCKKKRIWKSQSFFITLKNIKYGVVEDNFRSGGGKDGIFSLDRKFRPRNNMQKKIFDHFIDKATSGFSDILQKLDVSEEEIQAVRVVSHHMRLLGIYHKGALQDVIVLVDFDDTKE